jgi:hypothetical protein
VAREGQQSGKLSIAWSNFVPSPAEQRVHVLHRGERRCGLVVGHDHDHVLAGERRCGERQRGQRCGEDA